MTKYKLRDITAQLIKWYIDDSKTDNGTGVRVFGRKMHRKQSQEELSDNAIVKQP